MSFPPNQRTAIPFIRQQPIDGNHRTCAAVALAMAYRSLGQPASPADIWQRLATGAGPDGHIASYRLAADALNRGLQAVVLRAEPDPIAALRLLSNTGWRAILNHQLITNRRWGHFSMLVAVDDQRIVLHDPNLGPHRTYSHAAWPRLWLPNAEISGFVVIAIGSPNPSALQLEIICPKCATEIPLPADLLQTAAGEPVTCWDCLFCPRCDAAICMPNIEPRVERQRRTA